MIRQTKCFSGERIQSVGEANLEKELQDLVEQLGGAIDQAIAESERIGEIVREMEQAGYDLSLVLEATMRLSPKSPSTEEELQRPEVAESEFHSSFPGLAPAGKFDLTPEDEEFLQSLKVTI
jgi:hypothetical protein